MLLRIRDLRGDRLHAEDGEVGSVDELYFDDEAWDVRYLAVDTRRWMPGRKYFISPIAIGRSRRFAPRGDIRVELTREQISRCPTPRRRTCARAGVSAAASARDGVIGTASDLVVDDETWEITDVLVDSATGFRAACCLSRRR